MAHEDLIAEGREMQKLSYHKPLVVDYGSIADHTFGKPGHRYDHGVFPASVP